MIRLKNFFKKYMYYILITLVILIVILIFIFKSNFKSSESIQSVSNNLFKEKNDDLNQEVEKSKIKVDIKGAIISPGVYELDSDSRVIDVINKAGGLLEDANTEYLNLSQKLNDEMVIIIYFNSEVDKFKKEDKNVIYIKYECECIDNINDACIKNDNLISSDINYSEENSNESIVSINSANVNQLMTLPGIGESKAKAIIEYREKQGLFEKLEDIMNVSGIGESAYNKIKEYIKL